MTLESRAPVLVRQVGCRQNRHTALTEQVTVRATFTRGVAGTSGQNDVHLSQCQAR